MMLVKRRENGFVYFKCVSANVLLSKPHVDVLMRAAGCHRSRDKDLTTGIKGVAVLGFLEAVSSEGRGI